MRSKYNIACYVITIIISVLSLVSAHAENSGPAIADIRLGMTAEQVKPTLEKNAGNTPIRTYSTQKVDGSGTYVSGYSVNIASNKPRAAGFGPADDRIAIVFGQFNGGGALTVMRTQDFSSDALPGMATIEKSVEDSYGVKLHANGKNSFIALDTRDRDGKPTQDKVCISTTTGYGSNGQYLEGMQVWSDLSVKCGVLLLVKVYTGQNDAIAVAIEQKMIDTQTYIADSIQRQHMQDVVVQKRTQEDVSRANQIAPKL